MSLLELNPITARMLIHSLPFWALLTYVLWKYSKDAEKWTHDLIFGLCVHFLYFIWVSVILFWRSS